MRFVLPYGHEKSRNATQLALTREAPMMRTRIFVILSLTILPACGGGSGGSNPNTPNPPAPAPTPVPTPTPEAAAFGPGQYLVNSRIAPGRYFADPQRTGCYWERLRGLGGTLGEIISNDVFTEDPMQVIVDILPSDLAFNADADCGNWYTTPRHGAQTTIRPGIWLVGAQLSAGTYQANVGNGCYWERLRHFDGSLGGIIANDFISTAGPRLVAISASDVGFNSDADCGTWAVASANFAPLTSSAATIQRARDLNRAEER